MVDRKRLRVIEAELSFNPLPTDTLTWRYEPAMRLLTEEEGDRLVPLFEQITDHNNHIITMEMTRLPEQDVALLETFIRKSADGMRAMKDGGFPSVLAMNMASSIAA